MVLPKWGSYAPSRCTAMSGVSFGCHGGVRRASGGCGHCYAPYDAQDSPAPMNHPVQNVSSTEIEKPRSKRLTRTE